MSLNEGNLTKTQVVGDTRALTAVGHNDDAVGFLAEVQRNNELYKELIENLRRQVDEAKEQVANIADDLMEKLEPTIDHTRKNLHVAIINQREENKKLQEQIVKLKKEKAELVQNIISLKKKTDELQKELGKYPGQEIRR